MTVKQIGAVSVITLALLMASSMPALAYLDPGTGSMILQGLIGLVAGALVAIKIYWAKIRLFFSSKRAPNPAESRSLDKD